MVSPCPDTLGRPIPCCFTSPDPGESLSIRTSDWEVVLRPPVNRVIPVSRRRLRGLLARFGE